MSKTIALYGGGFKPPTKGHAQVVQQTLSTYPEIDELIIYVGNKERDGIGQSQSLLIWDIYKPHLSSNIKIEPTKKGPIGEVLSYAKNNLNDKVYFILGARDGNDGDEIDIENRTKGIKEKYPNIEVKIIRTADKGMSGSAARKALTGDQSEFPKFLPDFLDEKEEQEIWDLLRTTVSLNEIEQTEIKYWALHFDLYQALIKGNSSYEELSSTLKDPTRRDALEYFNILLSTTGPLNENATYSTHIDFKQQIEDLTQYLLSQGKNIEPLPQVEYVDGDSENAQDFFGKTAYYDPNTQTIFLFTEGRHPKDIVRSFSHEMIHHTQNLEDRLGGITTTDTTEDSNLEEIESEAYLQGNIIFRNWTDSLTYKKSDLFGLTEYATKIAEDINSELEKGVEVEKEHTDNEGIATKIALDHLREDPEYYTKLATLGLEEEKKKFVKWGGPLTPIEDIEHDEDKDYLIYSDMDGVLTDFNPHFTELSGGIPSSEYDRNFGREKFWKFIDQEGGEEFWAEMPWMKDGKTYWNYIKGYNPELLSSPLVSDSCKVGKQQWVDKNMPGTKLNLEWSKYKKNFARPNAILIDDKKYIIEQWIEAGGIGIIHTSAQNTIKQLKKLGL